MSEAFNYDNIKAGDFDVITKSAIIKTGSNLVAGTVLGRISRELGATTYAGTGNGLMSGQAMKTRTKLGNYTAKLITAAANGGTFAVYDPDGNRLSDAVVGTPYVSPQINFTIADGATDFILGDTFTIPVVAPVAEKFVAVNSVNVDGSNEPDSVLMEATDATMADVVGVAYESGEFQSKKLVFGGTDTVSTHKEAMRRRNLYVKVAM